MADPQDLAASIGRQDRVRLLQWLPDGSALDEKDATMDQLGAAVVQRIAATPQLAAAMPKNLSGDGVPTVGLGNDNDSYVDLLTGDTYLKTSGAWVQSGNIRGPEGPQGVGLVEGTGTEPYDVNFTAGSNVYLGFNFNDPRIGDDLAEVRNLNVLGNYYRNGVLFTGGGGGGTTILANSILGNAAGDSAGAGFSVSLSTDFTISAGPSRAMSIAAQALRNLAVWPSLENPARDHGAAGNGATDDSAPVNAAVAAAIVAGTRFVQIDRPFYVPSLSQASGDVVFIGRGTLIGDAIKRKLVIPPFAPPPPLPPRGVNVRHHCPVFTAAIRASNAATVVLLGDSVSTPMIGSVSASASLWQRLGRKIRGDNPGSAITLVDRGIGGARMVDIDGIATSFPIWYTNTGRAWLEYVKDLAPHLIIINVSRNDGLAFSVTALQSILAKVATWPIVPDVILSNSVGDKITAAASPSAANTAASGFEYAAGWMASCARALNKGLLNFARQERLIRFGYDLDDLPLLRDNALTGGVTTILKYSLTLPLTWPTTVYDFGGIFYIGAGGWTSLGNELTFEIGSHAVVANRGCRFKIRRSSSTGQIQYRVETLSTALGAASDWVFLDWTDVPGWIVGPSDETGFTFQVRNSQVYFEPASYGLSGTIVADRYTPGFYGHVPRAGGPFVPMVTCAAGSVAGVLRLTNNTIDGLTAGLSGNPAAPSLYMPQVVDYETGLPHPADVMWPHLQPVIDACDFCAKD